jgi:iron complex outermembrane receptor protein
MKRLLWTMGWLCLSLGLLAQGGVAGKVVEASSGKAVAGVRLSLSPGQQEVQSDESGDFQIPAAPGRYLLRAEAEGYLPWELNVRLPLPGPLSIRLLRESPLTEEVIISATRAGEKTATTYSSLDAEEIRRQNFGQDLPFLLNQVPGTVVSSDAGAGIGYTGIRIRGTDPTRTNVTINGIPLNDPESHGVFWVNLPDLASSTDNIQVQRGVGTSTHGAAAFGATLNLQTHPFKPEPFAAYTASAGSFSTWRHSLEAGSGLLKGGFAVDARLSRIQSDGWVDRAFSDLRSLSVNAARYGSRSLLKFVLLSGQEQTYQSWFGIPEAYLSDPALRRSNYYTYDNETDNYQQDHYQLFYSLSPARALTLNAALHYTYGRGYYEQYRAGDELAFYGLVPVVLGGDTVRTSDFIRRRWLDNHFYGFTFSGNYDPAERLSLIFGASGSRYDGEHFGELIWARVAGSSEIRDRYYESFSRKQDRNAFLKATWQPLGRLSVYADLQLRSIGYRLGDSILLGPGLDNGGLPVLGDYRFLFFNPKAGLTWALGKSADVYASWAVAQREPVRSDFIDAPAGRQPLPERLSNVEAGFRYQRERLFAQATYYFMDYRNQLVLNGQINDVGASVRQNVPDSYRMGVELDLRAALSPALSLAANLALSRNRIRVFEEYLYNYDPFEVEIIRHEDSDIAFSPALVGGGSLGWTPLRGLELRWLSKYVGRQFLDNTSNPGRALDAFWVNDLHLRYELAGGAWGSAELGLLVNNALNAQYEPNGYTFSYRLGADLFTENYFYPQAGRNFLLRLSVRM